MKHGITTLKIITDLKKDKEKISKGMVEFEHVDSNNEYNCVLLLCNKISTNLIYKIAVNTTLEVEEFKMFRGFTMVRTSNQTNISVFVYKSREGFRPGQVARLILWEINPK